MDSIFCVQRYIKGVHYPPYFCRDRTPDCKCSIATTFLPSVFALPLFTHVHLPSCKADMSVEQLYITALVDGSALPILVTNFMLLTRSNKLLYKNMNNAKIPEHLYMPV